jgi:hypothetical protein
LGVFRLGVFKLGVFKLGVFKLGALRLGGLRLGVFKLGVLKLGVLELGVFKLGAGGSPREESELCGANDVLIEVMAIFPFRSTVVNPDRSAGSLFVN